MERKTVLGSGLVLAFLLASGAPLSLVGAQLETTSFMTGGGNILAGDMKVAHGFELNCDASLGPNNLGVNWTDNEFVLENLTSAICTDDPAIDPGKPAADFDTYEGTGTGTLNNVSGATAHWIFTDAGEPGVADTATIDITDADGNLVLSVSGLIKGNHQAHTVVEEIPETPAPTETPVPA